MKTLRIYCKLLKIHDKSRVSFGCRLSAAQAAVSKASPQGAIDLINFIDLTDLTDLIIFRIFVNTNTIKIQNIMRLAMIIITTTIVCHSCKDKTPDKTLANGYATPDMAEITANKNTKETTITLQVDGDWALFEASSIDALDTLQTPIGNGNSSSTTTNSITIPSPEKKYYRLVTPRETFTFSERQLPMAGGYNFRDLGGFPTQDGRHVKWGKLFRSDDLHKLTEADLHYLSSIPVTSVVDFRGPKEIANAPDKLSGSTRHAYKLSIEPGNVLTLVNFSDLGPEQLDNLMTQIYVHLVTEEPFIERYRTFFQLLQDSTRVPLLFHCSAGKDRTGTAAALILYALGVDEAIIMEDYLASNHYLGDKYAKELEQNPGLKPVLTVKREFLQAAIDRIKQDHGSVENFLVKVLHVDIPKFKARYLY